MPSPIVIASILARETKRCKIAMLGSAIPLREHPLTLAEEHAMIDTISGGRLISGFVRGIGAEYHAFGVNPAESHDRFHEAHDLIVRAWTEARARSPSRASTTTSTTSTSGRGPSRSRIRRSGFPSQGSARDGRVGLAPGRNATPICRPSAPLAAGEALPRHVPREAAQRMATRPPTTSSAGRCRSTSARPTRWRCARRSRTSRHFARTS